MPTRSREAADALLLVAVVVGLMVIVMALLMLMTLCASLWARDLEHSCPTEHYTHTTRRFDLANKNKLAMKCMRLSCVCVEVSESELDWVDTLLG